MGRILPSQQALDAVVEALTKVELTRFEAEEAETKLGTIRRLQLTSVGSQPRVCKPVRAAFWSLSSARDSVVGLFDTLYLVRDARSQASGRGARRLTQDAQDLLRAAIVFSSAGFDASIKALLEGAVPVLARHNDSARDRFHRFIRDQVNAEDVEIAFQETLVADDPREAMLDLYKQRLKLGSFQKSGQIKSRVRSALGITDEQVPTVRIKALDPFFKARNEVAHEMDQLPDPSRAKTPKRRTRSQDDVETMCDHAFQVALALIDAAATNIRQCSKGGGR